MTRRISCLLSRVFLSNLSYLIRQLNFLINYLLLLAVQ